VVQVARGSGRRGFPRHALYVALSDTSVRDREALRRVPVACREEGTGQSADFVNGGLSPDSRAESSHCADPVSLSLPEDNGTRQPDTPKRFRLAGNELDRKPEWRVAVGEEPHVGLDPQRVPVDADDEIADALGVPTRDEHGKQGAQEGEAACNGERNH
jgi:hypothetical protein